MAVASGTRVGPYEIVELIGAGGMGEVYRAKDSRLGRDVAIKVLPAHFAEDAERLRRFEQEARAAGMLNHPNILDIHDIGNFGGMPYVVSELLEGETLRARLASGALPFRKTTDYALQIARGLAEAHDKGIVHRDLKPENIFITKDGRVKILDFGLAKLTQVIPLLSGPQSSLPTEAGTESGIVLGTAGYMSPEQVRGKIVDHRSDIFTFGAILYEMLSGRRAFRGDSAIETMNAILKQEPEEITLSGVPPAIERILKHCLEKNPEERFQSVSDLAFALETVSSVSAITAPAAPSVQSRKFNGLLIALLALPLLLLGLWGATFFMKPEKKLMPSFQRLTFRRGIVFNSLFAPDSQIILYSAAWEGRPPEVFQTQKDAFESRALDLKDADILSISKSGEMLILLNPRFQLGHMSEGTLARMPSGGGAPREVLENVSDADWHPDNGQIAAIVGWRRLEYPPGKLLVDVEGWISQLRFSPDGSRIAFLNHPRRGDNAGFISITDLSGKTKNLTEFLSAANGLAWSPDGKELWYSGTYQGERYQLYAIDAEDKNRQVSSYPGHIQLHDISKKGEILFSLFDPRRGVVAFPAGAEKEIDLSWFEWSFGADLSDDGKQILITEMGEGAGKSYAIYLRNTDGSPAVRLGTGWGLSLSPDKKYVAGLSYPDSSKMFILPTGVGNIRELPKHVDSYDWVSFTHTSDEVIFAGRTGKESSGMYLQKISDGSVRKITSDEVNLPYVISHDGKKVIATGFDGSLRIYSIDGGEPHVLPLQNHVPLQWTEDGSSIFTARFEETMKIIKYDLASGASTEWKEIIPGDAAGVSQIGPIQITPDGKSYSYSYRRQLTDLYVGMNLIGDR